MSRSVKNALSFGIAWLFCFSNALSNTPFFTKEKELHSHQTGKHLLDLSFSVISHPDNPDEYDLNISNAKSSNSKSVWVFRQKMDAKLLKKSDSSIGVKDIDEFSAFCENAEVHFKFSGWKEIKTSLKLPFSTTVTKGNKIDLNLCFYVASQNKKKTIIEDKAKVKLEFFLYKQGEEVIQKEEPRTTTLIVDNTPPGKGENTPEVIARMEKEREDSIKQVKQINKIQDLVFFISKKNEEINALCEEIVSNEKVGKEKIDSLEAAVIELKKIVDLKENGNVDLIADVEGLVNQFTEFSKKHDEAVKKIAELRVETNWAMYIGIGMGILMLGGMLFMQIWNPIKLKRQQRKQQKIFDEQEKKRALESVDIIDLDEI